MLDGHAGVVSSAGFNDDGIANLCFGKRSCLYGLWFVEFTGEQVPTFTGMSDNNVVCFLCLIVSYLYGLLNTIHTHSWHLVHTGIELEKTVTIRSGVHDIDSFCKDTTTIHHEILSWFDF